MCVLGDIGQRLLNEVACGDPLQVELHRPLDRGQLEQIGHHLRHAVELGGEARRKIDGALNGSLLKWGLIIAFFGTVIPPLCFAIGVPRAGLALSSILSAAELPVAVLLSALFLNDHVSAGRWLGVVVILSAIAVSNLKQLLHRKQKLEKF